MKAVNSTKKRLMDDYDHKPGPIDRIHKTLKEHLKSIGSVAAPQSRSEKIDSYLKQKWIR